MSAQEWERIARLLAARLDHHAYCNVHPEDKPDLECCPFCRDRDAYLQYEKVRDGRQHRGRR